eukprot:scaffold22963_cov101-Isochrysis_galbana.AAC.3
MTDRTDRRLIDDTEDRERSAPNFQLALALAPHPLRVPHTTPRPYRRRRRRASCTGTLRQVCRMPAGMWPKQKAKATATATASASQPHAAPKPATTTTRRRATSPNIPPMRMRQAAATAAFIKNVMAIGRRAQALRACGCAGCGVVRLWPHAHTGMLHASTLAQHGATALS